MVCKKSSHLVVKDQRRSYLSLDVRIIVVDFNTDPRLCIVDIIAPNSCTNVQWIIVLRLIRCEQMCMSISNLNMQIVSRPYHHIVSPPQISMSSPVSVCPQEGDEEEEEEEDDEGKHDEL